MTSDIPLKSWVQPARWSWRDAVRQRLAALTPGQSVTVLVPNEIYIQGVAEDLNIQVVITCLGQGKVPPYHHFQVMRVDHSNFWDPPIRRFVAVTNHAKGVELWPQDR